MLKDSPIAPIKANNINTPHGFFTRAGGISDGIYASLNCGPGSGDVREHVQENRRRIATHFGTNVKQLLTLYQTHSADVVTLSKPWEDSPPRADALVTKTPGIILGILTADCAPVLFSDAQNGVIAAAHAGWKGACEGIIEETVSVMETLGATRETITAAIGPCIAQESYEVDEAFHTRFLERNAAYAHYFFRSAKNAHYQFDLKAFVSSRLVDSGVRNNVVSVEDTYASADRFFSYRRTCHAGEKDYGRQISAVML